MIMSTGKTINDLGDFDLCEKTPGLKHGTFAFAVKPIGFLYLGVCLPDVCTDKDVMPVADSIVKLSNGTLLNSQFVFASDDGIPITPVRAIGFVVFGLLAIVYILGVITEYTPLFNRGGELNSDVAKNKTVLGKALISFSPTRNFWKLFYSPFNADDPLKVLNGVRVLSMLYVVLGHAYYNVLLVPTSNPTHIPNVTQPLWWQPIPGGFFAVDVFFYLSAFLGSYMMLMKFEKSKRINFPMIYFHRFYRLAPNVLLLILFAMTFYAYLGSGPVWFEQKEKWTKDCPSTFWAYITFVNAIWPGDTNRCVGWLWYLSHDFIFFLFLPFQVLFYYRCRKVSYIIAYSLLLANLGLVAFLTVHFDLGTTILSSPEGGRRLYFKPWARFGAYQVGMIFGYMYYEYVKGEKDDSKKNTIGYKFYKSVQISRPIRWAFYGYGVAMMTFLVFIVTPDNRMFLKGRYWGTFFSAVYCALCRPLYVMALGMVLMGPIVGKNQFLQIFLGSRFWAPWAKVAFYSYLVHLFVFTWYFGQMRQSFFLNHKSILWSYFGVISISMFIATFLSVLFEAPLMQLEKLVLFPPRKKIKIEEEEEVEEPEPSQEFFKYNTGLQEKGFDNEFSETIDSVDDQKRELKKRYKGSI